MCVLCVCVHARTGATEAKGASQIWLRQTAMLLATPLLFYLLLRARCAPQVIHIAAFSKPAICPNARLHTGASAAAGERQAHPHGCHLGPGHQ